MPKKTAAKKPKHSRLGKRLIEAGNEILAHLRGEIQLPGRVIEIPDPKDIRERLGLSQSEFANRFRINLRTLQDWERRRTVPDAAVRAYLTVIQRNPDAVIAALDPPLTSRAGSSV